MEYGKLLFSVYLFANGKVEVFRIACFSILTCNSISNLKILHGKIDDHRCCNVEIRRPKILKIMFHLEDA